MGARELFDKFKQAKATRAAVALAQFVGGGGKTVPPEVYDQRMATCQACPHFRDGEFPHCSDCGCYLKVKCQFPAEACPQNKWQAHRELTKKETEVCCPGS